MLQMLKRYCWLVVLGLGAPWASAFSLLGPVNEAYQVILIGYNLPGDIGAPKNLAEEYRRNTPVMYYSFDGSFLDYFGSNGVVAVEQAFDILNGVFDGRNNGVTNVSGYSGDLYEFPLEAQRVNFQAQALGLFDLKSATLRNLVEQMGLAEPDRFTWSLHDRLVGPGGCPQDVGYTVIKRNFDPITSPLNQLQPSSYVNGTLYSYIIREICSSPPATLADAIEFPVDPLANTFTAIASYSLLNGFFYTGLTRDDIAGFRYLWRTNNMNIESAGPDTITFVTNTSTHQLLYSSNLTLFASQALTNDAAALSALYPGLIITDTAFFFTNVVTTNVFGYYTNSPYVPFGTPATLSFGTNFTTNILTYYRHAFANVITNLSYSTGRVTILETNVGPCSYAAPYGTICTNVSAQTFVTPMIMGDFFIIPTNLCGYSVLATQLVQVLSTTNLLFVATNAPATTNIANQEFSRSIVNYFTNYVLDIRPVICPSNTVALRQGMERIQFIRRDYDSLLNRFYYPTNNEYTLNSITNNTLIPQRIQRLVTTPDFLMTAQDLATDPGDDQLGAGGLARSIEYSTNSSNPNLAGPGTILPSTASWFTYNKVGPIYLNFSPNFMDEASQSLFFLWGSFDGSTNAPVVYPNGTSIENLENQVLIQINPPPPTLPNAVLGVNYSNLFSGFTATGGVTLPTSWSLPTNSPALPPGLTLNPNGTITGTPDAGAVNLTFDFTVRMMDTTARWVDTPYSIKVVP